MSNLRFWAAAALVAVFTSGCGRGVRHDPDDAAVPGPPQPGLRVEASGADAPPRLVEERVAFVRLRRMTAPAVADPTTSPSPAALTPADAALAGRLRLATWNLEWFFDLDPSDNIRPLPKSKAAPSAADYRWKRDALADAINDLRPDILAVQEIENEKVMKGLARALRTRHNLGYTVAFVQGGDTQTEQDVAFLVREGLAAQAYRWEFPGELGSDYKNLSKHRMLEVDLGGETLYLLNIHLVASTGAAERQRQARTVRYWLGDLIAQGRVVVVMGDTNSGLRVNETTPGSEIGIVRGFQTPTTSDDLDDLSRGLPAGERRTHLNGKEYDRVLVSPSLQQDASGRPDLVFERIDRREDACIRGQGQDSGHGDGYWSIPEAERDISDHYPLVVEFAVR